VSAERVHWVNGCACQAASCLHKLNLQLQPQHSLPQHMVCALPASELPYKLSIRDSNCLNALLTAQNLHSIALCQQQPSESSCKSARERFVPVARQAALIVILRCAVLLQVLLTARTSHA